MMRLCMFVVILSFLQPMGVPHSVFESLRTDRQWQHWKYSHTKMYASESEELERYVIWRTNKAYVEYHNSMASTFGYTLALNKFGDMASEEFCRNTKCFGEWNSGDKFMKESYFNVSKHDGQKLPESVDWRQKGLVTAVKDQGLCHSCYAFAVTGMLEGLNALSNGSAVKLSEQNIIDCSVLYGNRGCSGGDRMYAINYVIDNGGINTEADYPYKARQSLCYFSASAAKVSCTGIIKIAYGQEYDMMVAVAFSGPLSVSIDASHNTFQFYASGIYNEPLCSTTELTHSLLIVGYGKLGGKSYWLVKNSWGVNWGDNGYILMTKDSNNQCGIASNALFLSM